MAQHNELITPNLRTTSRLVAEKFGKLHKNILQGIENLAEEAPEGWGRLNFQPTSYLDAQGREQPQYELTRDGFTLLAMGFSGKVWTAWKVRFIEAFNLMEAELSAKVRAEALVPVPSSFGDDLGTRDKLTMIRETRLLHGIPAGRRMWAMLGLPDVSANATPIGIAADPADGRACLTYVLGLDVGGRQVGSWLSDGQDHLVLNRVGLRVREDGLFISHAASVFQGSRWSGARHRVALITLTGVHPLHTSLSLAGVQQRGLLVPLAVAAEVPHA